MQSDELLELDSLSLESSLGSVQLQHFSLYESCAKMINIATKTVMKYFLNLKQLQKIVFYLKPYVNIFVTEIVFFFQNSSYVFC